MTINQNDKTNEEQTDRITEQNAPPAEEAEAAANEPLNADEISLLTDTPPPKPSKWKTAFFTILKEWVPSILIAFGLWYLLSTFVIQSVRIPTESMVPTIIKEDRVMILKFLYFDELEHGDIVVFYPPVTGKEDVPYIKRLVGLPGDQVETRNGVLYRNGKQVNEDYLNESTTYYDVNFGTVPKGKYLFLGDNRNRSADASTFATQSSGSLNWTSFYVSEDKIIGKALFRFYPIDRFGAVKRLD